MFLIHSVGVKEWLTNSNLMFPSCRKRIICIVVLVVVLLILAGLAVFLGLYFTQEKEDKQEDKRSSLGGPYSRQAVATDTEKCSEIGNDTLNANGSAVDAAIAAMFCLGVINMHSSGVGGGGVMLVYNRKLKKAKVIDFRETAPAATTSDMFPPTESGKNMSIYGKCYCFLFRFCPRRDFAQKAKSRVYIEIPSIYQKSTYSSNIQSVYQKKNLDLLDQGPHGIVDNDDISVVHARKYELDRMTEIARR